MNALNDLLHPALLRAAGFTLVHSLWQGAVVALSAALLLLLLHRHRAAVRYRVLLGALALVVALAAVTFASYYRTGPSATASVTSTTSFTHPEGETFQQPDARGRKAAIHFGFASQTKAVLVLGIPFVERHLPLLVGTWLLGLLAMTLRFLAGLASVRRLRHYRVAALPDGWQHRLDALCAQAGLVRRVQLLASALVPSPVVVGYFKPVILLPISAATGLSPRELEMILAHEVAHVLRQDYLVNLLQALAEAVFFYHPAVWFLSAALRIEREHCCDDVATQLCGDPRTLAQALSSLAELTYAEARAPRLALAATGPKGAGSLLVRVRRLVTHQPAAPAFLEGFWATCVMLVSTGLLAGSTLASVDALARPAAVVQKLSVRPQLPTSVGGRRDSIFVPTPRPQVAEGAVGGKQLERAQARPLAEPKHPSGREWTALQPVSPLRQQPAPEMLPAMLTPPNKKQAIEQARRMTPADLIEADMIKNGLLPNPRHYEYTLRASSLVVNGMVQPAAVAAKYRRLYEAASGEKMWPLLSSLYRNVHDDDAPATGFESISTP